MEKTKCMVMTSMKTSTQIVQSMVPRSGVEIIWLSMKSAFILRRYSLLQYIFEKETKCMVMMPIKLSTKNYEIRGSWIRVPMGPIWSYIEISKQFCNSKHADKDHRM